ncbi:MAG: DegV family protein [Lachnospiraceae bacterium]|jgi:DegV family protein with EDD domain|nr:DegV family protein [Lachnospiraceae bacterium]
MSYKIIVDSCGELPESYKKDEHFESVPLTLDIDGHLVVDDKTFDQADFLRRVAQSPNCPKSSCPSPERYLEAYACEAENIYAVTLSAELSGSYNSAELGKKLYLEERGEKNIYVFNSRSASIGQTLIAMKIEACEKAGMAFREVVEHVESYIAGQNTYFVLESLEALRKNGRLSNLKAFVANALNIKPVMGATPIGTICQLDQARGINRALKKMVEYIARDLKDPGEKRLAISHCNCPERARMVKEEILKHMPVKDVLILDTAGVSSLYASDGGIIVVV